MLQNMNDNLVVRFFQLPLSLRNISLDPNNGMRIEFHKYTFNFGECQNFKLMCFSFGRDLASSMSKICLCFINRHVDVYG